MKRTAALEMIEAATGKGTPTCWAKGVGH